MNTPNSVRNTTKTIVNRQNTIEDTLYIVVNTQNTIRINNMHTQDNQ